MKHFLYESQKRKQFPAQIFLSDKVRLPLGLIAPGIHNERHRVSPEILQRELEIASRQG